MSERQLPYTTLYARTLALRSFHHEKATADYRTDKGNLKDAFWKLYTEKSIEKISIKEITDLAGYNRGTFYLYYKDVYDIFSQIEDELLDKIKTVLDESLQNDTFDLSDQMGVLFEMMRTHSHYATV